MIVIVVAAIVFGSGDGDPGRLVEFAPDVPPLQGAFAASIIAFFSFLGFEAAANMAEEVRNPSKAYPARCSARSRTAAVVYLLIAIGAVDRRPPAELAESTGPLLDVVTAQRRAGPAWLFGLIALVAIANGALLFMVMASRVGYGLAEAELLPGAFARVLPNRRTPWVVDRRRGRGHDRPELIGDVSTLAETTVLLLILVFISANISVLVLKKDKVDHEHFSRAADRAGARDHRQHRAARRSSPASCGCRLRPVTSSSARCCPHRPRRSQTRGAASRSRGSAARVRVTPLRAGGDPLASQRAARARRRPP